MAQYHENRYAMQMATAAFLRKHAPLWRGNELITESVDYIEPRLDRAQELFDKKEDGGTKGYTAHKNNFIDDICTRSWLLSKRLSLYARRSKNTVLLAQTDQPQRHFDNGSEIERIGRCASVVQWATTHIANLAPYKVTESDLAALSADIERARPLSSDRDTIGDGQQLLNKTLPQLLQEIQDKLYELDDEVVALMDEHPEFQEEYKIARRVTDRKATQGKGMSNE
ncbi:MAG: hypothetical protein EOO15_16700 [Chitinophagaceae bacterium]|nr:MAG: hypothetical protein EOO15_16700 [Chitinophagaceae bacterium]